MPPRTDVTAPRRCRDCGVVQPPANFERTNLRRGPDNEVIGYGLRPECRQCGAAAAAAARAAAPVDLAEGATETVPDFLGGLWTITEGKKAEPRPRVQKYVKYSDISPAFASGHGIRPGVKAKVTDAAERIAHASPASADTFVPLADILRAMGLRKCTVCTEVLPLERFAIADRATNQLRGNCRACQA